MSRISARPLTVADLPNVVKELPEEFLALGRQAAAQWVAARRKKPGRRKSHASKR